MGRIALPRRKLLQGIGATAGLAACGPGGQAGAPLGPAARGKIDTIVMCMMENRSFDHVFGSLSLLEGRTDVNGLRADMTNPDLDGNPVPITLSQGPCVDPDPPHGWDSSRTAHDGGTNQGFVRAFLEDNGIGAQASIPMSYQDRSMQPISYALADAYALCQRWYSSLLTSTWPNRLYFHASQSQGQRSNDLPTGTFFDCRTIWDQLTDAGIEWGYYYTDLPTLILFGRPEYLDRMRTIEQYYADAAAGTLPSVACVDAGNAYNDDHPPHHPMLGQLFIGSVYQALATSPHWSSSLFALTYDEAGGFFDHEPPGTVDDDLAGDGFDQLGFRVPALLAGPYVRNVVNDDRFEHSAVLSFIQDHFGIDERLTLRNAASNDLSVMLDGEAMEANQPSPPIALPAIERSEQEIEDECRTAGRRTGQPELRRLVRAHHPELDRTSQLPDIARRAWRLAGDQGLWVPRR